MLGAPPRETPTPAPRVPLVPGKPLSPYAKHFQNEIATTAYTPFSDLGTVTEADVHKDAREVEAPTSMINISEMQRRMAEDMGSSGLPALDDLPSMTHDPALATLDMPSEIREDIAESDFFIKQGLFDEARNALKDLLSEHPNNPSILKRLQGLDGAAAAPKPADPPSRPSAPSRPAAPERPRLPLPPLDDRVAVESAGSANLNSHFELGLAYREMGLHQDAIVEFQIAVNEGQQVAEAHFLMAQANIELGDHQEAIGQLKQSLKAIAAGSALQPHAFFRIGLVYELIGNAQEARYYFQKIAARADLFPDVGQRLQRLS